MRPAVRYTLAVTMCFAASGCGSKADADSPQGETDPGTVGGSGEVDDNAPDVSGSFFVGSTGQPAAGYELWIADHTARDIARHPIGSSGSVTVALDQFVSGDVYSFHLVGDARLIGTFDLSQALDGAQEAITYEGGYGFSLGAQILTKDAFGRLRIPATLQAQVGGGFSLAPSRSGALADVGLPSAINRFAAGSQLLVYDPVTLLNAFYNRATNPSAHAAALGSLSRLQLSLEGATETAVSRAFVLEAGSWLRTSRLAASDDQVRNDASLWSAQEFELTAAGAGKFAASVFTGMPLDAHSVMALKAQPEAGPSLDLTAYFPRLFSMPPAVTAVSTSAGTPAPVAYTSTTATNGLTRPFCHLSGDVVAQIAMPLDHDGNPWTEDVAPYIDATFDYHVTASGKTSVVTPAVTDFAGSYAASFSEQAGTGGFLETWDPATRVLRLTAPASAAASATHTVTLPAELMLTAAGGSAVSLVRVKLVVRWADSSAESGAVLWLQKNC